MSSILSKLINLAGNITGTIGFANGGTGLTAVGTANQVLGTNSGATGLEYKTLAVGTSGSDFAVANAANSVTFNLPDAGASARGAVTTAAQSLAGIKSFQDGVKVATSGNGVTAITYYEEGTWTPTVTFGTTGNSSSSGASGTFWRLNKHVHVWGKLTINKGSTGTGSITFGGLPYAVDAAKSYPYSLSVDQVVQNINASDTLIGLFDNNGTAFTVRFIGNSAQAAITATNQLSSSTNYTFIFNGSYDAA